MPDEPRLASSVPREYLEILGAISVNFGALENALSFSIWVLLGGLSVQDEERYQVITAQLSFKQLVWMTANLYRQRFPARNEEIIEVLTKRCFKAEQERNTNLHSLWVGGDIKDSEQRALRLKITARSEGLKFHAEQHTKAHLIEVANVCVQLSDEIRSFIIGEMLTQLPETASGTT